MEVQQRIAEVFGRCVPLFRDADLTGNIIDKYKVGLFLREPTFCDATYKLSGFLAPVRFLLISSNARCLDGIGEDRGWGLCVWPRQRVFKVIDKLSADTRTQITLVEIPEDLIEIFCKMELNPLEESLVSQARETFHQCLVMRPLAELNTEAWKSRLVQPIGLNVAGDYFLLDYDPLRIKTEDEIEDDAQVEFSLSRVLNHQAQVHIGAGDLAEAQSALLEAIRFERSCEKPSPEILSVTHVILSQIHLVLGDLIRAEATLHEAFFQAKELDEDANRLLVSQIVHMLGQVYQHAGNYEYAERNYLHALKIARRIHGDRHSRVGTILSSLGALYEFGGDFTKSEACLREALEITREQHGGESAEYAAVLNNVARQVQALGRHKEAKVIFRDAVAILERQGSKRPRELEYNLAEVYAASGQPAKALHAFKQALLSDALFLMQAFMAGSERQRLESLQGSLFRVGQLLSLVIRNFKSDLNAVHFAADQVLSRKGLIAEALAIERDAFRGEDNADLRSGIRELIELRARIARETLAGPGSEGERAHRLRLADKTRRADDLEVRMRQRIPQTAFRTLLLVNASSRVARSIPPGAVLVEFVRYKSFDFTAPQISGPGIQQRDRYAAFVLIPEEPDHPRLIDLGDFELIDRAVEELRASIMGNFDVSFSGREGHNSAEAQTGSADPALGRDRRHLQFVESESGRKAPRSGFTKSIRDAGGHLFKIVLSPLLAAIADRKRLFLCPDGALSTVPFEILPVDGDRWLIDEWFVSYLSVGRDILRWDHDALAPSTLPLVIADPDYNLEDHSTSAQSLPEAPAPCISFEALPGTLHEGEEVASLLGVRPLLGASALKSVLEKRHSPGILHIATHGFVLNERPVPVLVGPEEFQVGRIVHGSDPTRRMIALDGIFATPARFTDANREDQFVRLSGQDLSNPMMRSGLALAGVNTWLRGGALPIEAGDGILTAQEVSGLDLSGTELVVLSACESGLGEVRPGEGVFGLRRSLVLAGARTIVISLWKVPDRPTQELMAEFYRRLIAGEPRASAMREAQREMKRRIPDPQSWGAFICQGNPAPLMWPHGAKVI